MNIINAIVSMDVSNECSSPTDLRRKRKDHPPSELDEKIRNVRAKVALSKWQKGEIKDPFAIVTRYLMPEDVAKCERVCKDWNEWISSTQVWKTQYKSHLPHIDWIHPTVRLALQSYHSWHVRHPHVFTISILSLVSGYLENCPMEAYKQYFANPCPSIAFGADQWKLYFGDVGAAPRLPWRIYNILNDPCPFFPGKKIEETHMLALIPESINDWDMTLKRLQDTVGGARTHGKRVSFYIETELTCSFSLLAGHYFHLHEPFESSHWVLMTKHTIGMSKGRSYRDQKKLVARYPHYQIPTLAEAAVCMLTYFIMTDSLLFSNRSNTYTRCKENYAVKHTYIGGFSSHEGLKAFMSVPYSRYDDSIGIAALRRL